MKPSTTQPLPRDSGTLDAWTFVHFLREHRLLLGLSVMLGLTTGAACMLWMPKRYTARAVLEVAGSDQPLAEVRPPAAANDLGSASLLKTVEQSVCGASVLDRVIRENGLEHDPDFVPPGAADDHAKLLEVLAHRVSAHLIRGTRLISVEAESPHPEGARRLAQSVIDAFFAQNLDNRLNEANSSREFLTAEASRLAATLSASEHRLQEYRERYGAVDLADQHRVDVERLRHLHELLNDARGNRLAIESAKSQIDAALASGDPDHLLDLNSVASLPGVIELRRQINAQNAQIAALAERYRDQHPLMVQAHRQLDELRLELNQAAHSAAESVLHAYQAARSTEDGLAREVGRQENQEVEFARIAIPYRALDREVQANTAIYQQLLARLKETDVVQNLVVGRSLSGSYVQLLEKPLAPDRPSRPRLLLVMPIALLSGASLGLAVALLRHALDDTVPSVDVAEACLGIATLAVVPQSNQIGFRSGRLRLPRPGSPEAESFRSLRTSLALLRDEVDRRATMFTSAVPGEGKSCCSGNFAIVVAQSGLRTLLIDGDLRRPRLRQVFRRRCPQPGLADCLAHPQLFDAALQTTDVPNLFLLGSNSGTPLAAELLAGDQLPKIIAASLARFDRVIVDTAPVAVVSDSLHFARLLPTICLVIRARHTPRRIIQRACGLLNDVAGHPPVGVVLNQIPPNGSAAYHYYYHGRELYAPKLSVLSASG